MSSLWVCGSSKQISAAWTFVMSSLWVCGSSKQISAAWTFVMSSRWLKQQHHTKSRRASCLADFFSSIVFILISHDSYSKVVVLNTDIVNTCLVRKLLFYFAGGKTPCQTRQLFLEYTAVYIANIAAHCCLLICVIHSCDDYFVLVERNWLLFEVYQQHGEGFPVSFRCTL